MSLAPLIVALCAVAARAGPVKDAFYNHGAAFRAQDMEKILKDYTDKSVINVYNAANGDMTTYKGLDGVKKCFAWFFKHIPSTSDLQAPVIDVHEAEGESPGSVLLIWNCKKSGFEEATDTYIFDEAGKIVTHDVVVTYTDPKAPEAAPDKDGPSHYVVHKTLANHFAALEAKDLDAISEGYSDQSTVTVYNQVDGKKSVFKGVTGIKKYFKRLFATLSGDMSDFVAPITDVKESGYVFLFYSAKKSGYKSVTDTWIVDKAGKILTQNIVEHYEQPTQPSKLYELQKQLFSRFGPAWQNAAAASVMVFAVGAAAAVVIRGRRRLTGAGRLEDGLQVDLE